MEQGVSSELRVCEVRCKVCESGVESEVVVNEVCRGVCVAYMFA